MKITELEIKGVYLIDCFYRTDERGKFVKTYNLDLLANQGIVDTYFKEIYFSVSKKNTIRGMHFQMPPFEHAKLIYVTSGKIMDVVLDIRKKSGTFGKAISVELESNKNSIYIPNGCAHGFKALKENSVVVYNQTSCYSKEHDSGVLWNSFGFDWGITSPILSDRDNSFPEFQKFISPFN